NDGVVFSAEFDEHFFLFSWSWTRVCGLIRAQHSTNGGAKGQRIEGRRAIGGTQRVTWARGTGSDTVEVEVKGNSYGSDGIGFSGGWWRGGAAAEPGFKRTGRDDEQHRADRDRRSGASAAGQPLLMDGDFRQDVGVQQGHDTEPEVYPRVPQVDEAAGDCGVRRRIQRQPAGTGV